jgi:hypothetical protein
MLMEKENQILLKNKKGSFLKNGEKTHSGILLFAYYYYYV